MAFEIDYLFHRAPVGNPAPVIELRLTASIQTEVALIAEYAQQVPALLLPDTERLAVAADKAFGQAVTQPSLGGAYNLHLMGSQPHLLLQFTKQRLFRGFKPVYTALRKLPGILADTSPPKEFALIVAEDDADIGAETV